MATHQSYCRSAFGIVSLVLAFAGGYLTNSMFSASPSTGRNAELASYIQLDSATATNIALEVVRELRAQPALQEKVSAPSADQATGENAPWQPKKPPKPDPPKPEPRAIPTEVEALAKHAEGLRKSLMEKQMDPNYGPAGKAALEGAQAKSRGDYDGARNAYKKAIELYKSVK